MSGVSAFHPRTKAACLKQAGCHRPPAREDILQGGKSTEVQLGETIIGMRPRDLGNCIQIQMILQVRPDIRLVIDRVDSKASQMVLQDQSRTVATVEASRWLLTTGPPRDLRR